MPWAFLCRPFRVEMQLGNSTSTWKKLEVITRGLRIPSDLSFGTVGRIAKEWAGPRATTPERYYETRPGLLLEKWRFAESARLVPARGFHSISESCSGRRIGTRDVSRDRSDGHPVGGLLMKRRSGGICGSLLVALLFGLLAVPDADAWGGRGGGRRGWVDGCGRLGFRRRGGLTRPRTCPAARPRHELAPRGPRDEPHRDGHATATAGTGRSATLPPASPLRTPTPTATAPTPANTGPMATAPATATAITEAGATAGLRAITG